MLENTRTQTQQRRPTAADAFAQRGPEASNTRDKSAAASLAKGTVYNGFPSQEALSLAVVGLVCRLATDVARATEYPALAA